MFSTEIIDILLSFVQAWKVMEARRWSLERLERSVKLAAFSATSAAALALLVALVVLAVAPAGPAGAGCGSRPPPRAWPCGLVAELRGLLLGLLLG